MLLCLFVLLYSLIRKEYRFAGNAVLSLVYFVLDSLKYSDFAINHSQLLGSLQRLTLVTLAVFVFVLLRKSHNKKNYLLVAICAWIACVSRFLRTILFDFYTGKMEASGADVMAIYTEFQTYYTIIDSVIKAALIVMLFSIAWRLCKPVITENA